VIFYLDAQLSKHHPSGRQELSIWTFLYVEKLRTVPKLHPSGRLSNTSGCRSVFDQLWNFFPKHKYGKIATTVWTMCVSVQTLSFIRQVVHLMFNRPDVSLHGPDAQASYMEIACISLTVRMSAFIVQTLQALIWKLRAAKVQLSGL
jgi:hypothetical protein